MNTTTPAPPAPKPVINPSPKTRFLNMSAPTIHRHHEMVKSDQFQLSVDHAMLDFVRRVVVNPASTNDALSGFYRIQGAHEFLQSLVTLAERTQPPQLVTKEDNLDHNV